MSTRSPKPPPEYNAQLIAREDVNSSLAIFRVLPDSGVFDFRPGQFAALGVLQEADDSSTADSPPGLVRRAYSIASPPSQRDYLEFYVQLVDGGCLTPRLWQLQPGDRLWISPKPAGRFTAERVQPQQHVVMFATGTGLAPYLSMIREMLNDSDRRSAQSTITVVHGARYARDLGYRGPLQELSLSSGAFLYAPTISRPGPGDHWVGHTGRAESIFREGTLERALGLEVRPPDFHVFLCGNPGMVEGLAADFTARGFTENTARTAGDLHLEKYWS